MDLNNSVYLSLLYGSVCGPCVSFRTVVHRVLVHSRFQQVVQHPANMIASYTEINEVLMGGTNMYEHIGLFPT